MPRAFGILVPQPGTGPSSSTLEGGFSTTAPPGDAPKQSFLDGLLALAMPFPTAQHPSHTGCLAVPCTEPVPCSSTAPCIPPRLCLRSYFCTSLPTDSCLPSRPRLAISSQFGKINSHFFGHAASLCPWHLSSALFGTCLHLPLRISTLTEMGLLTGMFLVPKMMCVLEKRLLGCFV